MRKKIFVIMPFILLLIAQSLFAESSKNPAAYLGSIKQQIVDAASFGFSSSASGIKNTKASQAAVDKGGSITVTERGIYKVAGTVYIGSEIIKQKNK